MNRRAEDRQALSRREGSRFVFFHFYLRVWGRDQRVRRALIEFSEML